MKIIYIDKFYVNSGSNIFRFFVKKRDYSRYHADYVKLYIDNIRAIVTAEDTSRPFVSSSPSNGVETAAKGWIAKDPQSPLFGDGRCLPSLYDHKLVLLVKWWNYEGIIC